MKNHKNTTTDKAKLGGNSATTEAAHGIYDVALAIATGEPLAVYRSTLNATNAEGKTLHKNPFGVTIDTFRSRLGLKEDSNLPRPLFLAIKEAAGTHGKAVAVTAMEGTVNVKVAVKPVFCDNGITSKDSEIVDGVAVTGVRPLTKDEQASRVASLALGFRTAAKTLCERADKFLKTNLWNADTKKAFMVQAEKLVERFARFDAMAKRLPGSPDAGNITFEGVLGDYILLRSEADKAAEAAAEQRRIDNAISDANAAAEKAKVKAAAIAHEEKLAAEAKAKAAKAEAKAIARRKNRADNVIARLKAKAAAAKLAAKLAKRNGSVVVKK